MAIDADAALGRMTAMSADSPITMDGGQHVGND